MLTPGGDAADDSFPGAASKNSEGIAYGEDRHRNGCNDKLPCNDSMLLGRSPGEHAARTHAQTLPGMEVAYLYASNDTRSLPPISTQFIGVPARNTRSFALLTWRRYMSVPTLIMLNPLHNDAQTR